MEAAITSMTRSSPKTIKTKEKNIEWNGKTSDKPSEYKTPIYTKLHKRLIIYTSFPGYPPKGEFLKPR